MVSSGLHPFQITLWRFLIGSLILLPPALLEIRRRRLRLEWKDWKFFIGLGFLCIVICMSFFQTAILLTNASIVAVVFSANPVFTIPFAYWLLKERVTWLTVLALVLGLSGVLVIMHPYLRASSADLQGIGLAVLAALTWSLYTVLGKQRVGYYGGIVQNCFSFWAGILALLPLFLVFRIPVLAGIGADNIWQLLYLGIFVSGLGFFFYFAGMGLTSAGTGSVVFFIKPALAAYLAHLVLGEALSSSLLLGTALIILGSLCFFRRAAAAAAGK